MSEIWKDIYGFEGKYQISNKGNVKSLKGTHGEYREKILKLQKSEKNYLFVFLYKNGNPKKYWIHKLVANAFIPNPKNLYLVGYKDGNTLNNNVDNLEWFFTYKTDYANKEVENNG